MFEELDSVPWSHLGCCCGSAAHVPEDVRALLSADVKVVEAAYWKLENHVVCQGDLYDSAAYLPSVLIDVLIIAKHKARVLDLLFEIGRGYHSDATIRERCFRGVMDGLKRWLGTHNVPAELKEEAESFIVEMIENESEESAQQAVTADRGDKRRSR